LTILAKKAKKGEKCQILVKNGDFLTFFEKVQKKILILP